MKLLTVVCVFLLVFQSCTIEKRLFHAGYHIEWKHRKATAEALQVEVSKPDTFAVKEMKTENSLDCKNPGIDVSEIVVENETPDVLPTNDWDDSLIVKQEQTIQSDTPDPNRKLRDGAPAALRMAEIAGGASAFLLFTGLLAILSFSSSSIALFTIAFSLGIVGVGALILGICCFIASYKRKSELTNKELQIYKRLKFFSGLVLSASVAAYVKVIQILMK